MGALSFAYDQLSRLTSAAAALGTVSYQYDAASRRTRMTWPDGFYVTTDYDLANAVTAIRENGAASGAGVLASFGYDDLGRRASLTRGNGAVTAYAYDAASRLATLTQDLPGGAANDQIYGLSYNAASQVTQRTGSNAAYNTPAPVNGTTPYARDGLNRYTNAGRFAYDLRGNLSTDGSRIYGYDVFNRLVSVTPSAGGAAASLAYDAAGRLRETVGSGVTTRFLYDGVDMIAEYNGANVLQRRYVHGPGIDEPLVWYEGSGTADRRYLITDQLGSIVAANGNASTTINAYDEYGQPAPSNTGRFQYTGQMWLGEAQLYHYKARAYLPALGRFAQTDPILYNGGMNLYAYVQNDPINLRDPWGLCGNYVIIHTATVYQDGEELASETYIYEQGYERCGNDWFGRGFDLGGGDSGVGGDGGRGGGGGVGVPIQLLRVGPLPRILLSEPPLTVRPSLGPKPPPFGVRPPASQGWQWRGRPGSSEGSREGNWYNPRTRESLRDDGGHGPGIEPHWDYRAPTGEWYRWFPDGRLELKSTPGPIIVLPGIPEFRA